ncbi:hypothetical protein [Halobacillus sp. H74]
MMCFIGPLSLLSFGSNDRQDSVLYDHHSYHDVVGGYAETCGNVD